MNDSDFEYTPLGKFVDGLYPAERRPIEEVKADLESAGHNPDDFIARMQAHAKALTTASRLSWKEKGAALQAKLDAAARNVSSWANRSRQEVEAAFNDVIRGSRGCAARMRVQAAFRNLTEVTPEDKAAFLDEVDLIQRMQATEARKDEEKA